jgi:hypothetical protein
MLWSKFCLIKLCFESKRNFFAIFFGKSILKIITSVPEKIFLQLYRFSKSWKDALSQFRFWHAYVLSLSLICNSDLTLPIPILRYPLPSVVALYVHYTIYIYIVGGFQALAAWRRGAVASRLWNRLSGFESLRGVLTIQQWNLVHTYALFLMPLHKWKKIKCIHKKVGA